MPSTAYEVKPGEYASPEDVILIKTVTFDAPPVPPPQVSEVRMGDIDADKAALLEKIDAAQSQIDALDAERRSAVAVAATASVAPLKEG